MIESVSSLVGAFIDNISDIGTLIVGSALFLIPVGIKIMGKSIGFTKSLIGTGGRRRR